MVKQKTKNLFWLNVKGSILRFLGALFIAVGVIVLAFDLIISILILIVGIYFLIIGNQKILEYKRESGYIVYNG